MARRAADDTKSRFVAYVEELNLEAAMSCGSSPTSVDANFGARDWQRPSCALRRGL